MAYKNGSLISPTIVKEWMVPRYRKITRFLRENGVEVIIGGAFEALSRHGEGVARYYYPVSFDGG